MQRVDARRSRLAAAALERAREIATLKRLPEYRNSMSRGASSGVDVVIE